MIHVERAYHPDGSLRYEGEYKGDIPHGRHRRWHPNGVLAEEWTMHEGFREGTIRQWNVDGELLGKYTIVNGTGVEYAWHNNGHLSAELTWIDRNLNGRVCFYDQEGQLELRDYYVNGKKVSKKRYDEACASNPRLPHYEDEVPLPKLAPIAAEPLRDDGVDEDALCLEFLSELGTREALAWLEEPHPATRTVGEGRDEADSLELVRTLYRFGAVRVHVVKLHHEPQGDQYSNTLIVELPRDQVTRRTVMDFCAEVAAESGFDATPDEGQRYILVWFD